MARRGLVGMAVAGGLVPSPSALIVLLSAIALGRTWFGIVLVLAYGMGRAAVLTTAGLALVAVRDRWRGRLAARRGVGGSVVAPWGRLSPFLTAAVISVVGVGLAVRI